jgi:hypothetical protein
LKNNSGRNNFDKFTKIVLKHFTNYGKLFWKLVKNALFTSNFGKRNINLRPIKCSSVRNDLGNTLLVRQNKLPTPVVIPKFRPCWRAPHVNIPGLHVPLWITKWTQYLTHYVAAFSPWQVTLYGLTQSI